MNINYVHGFRVLTEVRDENVGGLIKDNPATLNIRKRPWTFTRGTEHLPLHAM